MDKKTILIIPAYNPAETFVDVVKEMTTIGFYKIIVVNDGCFPVYNAAFEQIEKIERVDVLRHGVNLGKGRAIKTAINHVMTFYPDCYGIVTADADGQHKTEDINTVKDALLNAGKNELILGVRSFRRKGVPFRSRFGNALTKIVMKYFCGVKTSDTQTGLRAIRSEYLRVLMRIPGEQYEYETNVLLVLNDRHDDNCVKIVEVPISTIYENNNSVSHFNPIEDSIKIYSVILKYLLSSIICSLLDYIVFFIMSVYSSNLLMITVLGRTASALANFTINRKFVFQDKGSAWISGTKFLCLVVVSGTVSFWGQSVLNDIFAIPNNKPSLLIKIFVELFLFVINYYVQNNVVFVGKKGSNHNVDTL